MNIEKMPQSAEEAERIIDARRNNAFRDMDARTPEQSHLEIGTGGICAGYDPRRFADGDLVVTVDLIRGVGASAGHHRLDNIDQVYDQRNKGIRSDQVYDQRNTEIKSDAIPNYIHDSVIGDGRDLSFFGERKFSEVLMCNLACDPGISRDDLTKLLNESLSVLTDDGKLLLSEHLTSDIAEERLDKTNFDEAGVKLELADPLERSAVFIGRFSIPYIYKLTKTERWGEVPLRCYEDHDWAKYQLVKTNAERRAASEAKKQVRKQARREKLARTAVGRMFVRHSDTKTD